MHLRLALLAPVAIALLAFGPCPRPAPPIAARSAVPQEGQVFQRNGLRFAEVIVRHPHAAEGAAEARYGDAPWKRIDADASDGVAGALAVPVGWHRIEVRIRGDAAPFFAVDAVGVGDVFVIDGQSNAMMEGETRRTTRFGASVLPRKVADGAPSLFRRADDSLWTATRPGFGSAWPIVADRITAGAGVPVAFVATAEGGTGLVDPPDWSVGHFFWNRMIANTLVATAGTGRVAAVLKDQGEADAARAVSHDAFEAALCRYPDALEAALGARAPLVVSQTGRFLFVPEAQLQPIRDAQRAAAAAAACDDVYGGFGTTDLPKNFTGHYADAAIPELARRWCLAIATLPLYDGGPKPDCE